MTITPFTIRLYGRQPIWRLALCCLVAWPAIAYAHDAEGGDKNESAASSVVAQLNALLERSDERSLVLNPLNALSRGDVRYSDQFGDLVSDEYFQAVKSGAQQDLQDIQQIERSLLSTNEQIAYDVFKYQAEAVVASFEMGVQQTIQDLPIDDYTGLHLSFPQWSSGHDVAPYRSVADYERGLTRMVGFADYLDRAREQMAKGVARHHVLARSASERLLAQLESIVEADVEGSPLVGPVKAFPDSITEVDRARFSAAYRQVVRTRVLPAFDRLKEFVATAYVPASRTGSPGLGSMTDGPALYAYWLEQFTTTKLSATEIHALGLNEVARIESEMESVRKQVGFDGSLGEFFVFIQTSPQFKFKTKDELLERYRSINDRVQAHLPAYFKYLPKGRFEIHAVPPEQEAAIGGAYYALGTPDDARPGVFYVNTSNLPSQTTPRMTALFLHEAVPGHHLQGSLTQENLALPSLLRFGWNSGYGEGWALYAESLGVEMGLYGDPYQYFGRLDQEMFRALRLVVDTGLHAMGWSRQQAIDYMTARSSLGTDFLELEVDRYIAWPGQATAYKVGELVIRRLREEAEVALGPAFDVREFHEQVLNSGCIPLHVLEAKMRGWIVENQQSSADSAQ